jgi:hypothetical protein
MRTEVLKPSQIIVKQQAESQTQKEKIDKLSEVVRFSVKDKEIEKHVMERLLKELNEKDKLFFIQRPSFRPIALKNSVSIG